ncbi:hypothetical protein WJX73_009704 [Symbiochloris irregularis]|uniref:RNA helicase n=1 Tax=Symbiochloris irregularis TaxID=706552 RepID=A0AAW1Q2T6_9CHLO
MQKILSSATHAAEAVAWPTFDEVAAAAEAGGASSKGRKQRAESRKLEDSLAAFQNSPTVRDQALALYINAQIFAEVAAAFVDFLRRGMTPALADAITQPSASQAQIQNNLFELFANFALQNYGKEIALYREIVHTVDLTKPHLWYPTARAFGRRIVYHAGPTNSGKTFNALQAMSQAGTGVYCGPLRLLAMEVYDSLNAQGTLCNLLTGQEKREVPGARHTACTVEMANLNEEYDVAVIDEIQLLGDESRGWAWTRALQGLLAKEIHICGDGSALGLVRSMAKQMHEPVEVHNYNRFTPLEVQEGGLARGYQDVQPGDCIVAFSRRDIYDIKHTIEATTGQRVCVVYGALPPETRRQQARLFNEPGNEYTLLVASDAVGMGLNLNIRRVVFHTLHKTEGAQRRAVPVTQIKQIAGRAGRRSSEFKVGYATCLNQGDIPQLAAALETPLADLSTTAAGLFPEFGTLEAFAGQLLMDEFGAILGKFAEDARLEGTYFLCKQDSVMRAARLLSRVEGLSLQDRFLFCMAPANLRDPRVASALLHFATRYAAREAVTLDMHAPMAAPKSSDGLMEMELTHQVLSLWLWLSHRFQKNVFPEQATVQGLATKLIDLMDEGLQGLCAPRAFGSGSTLAMCSKCRKAGPPLEDLQTQNSPHKTWMCPTCRTAARAAHKHGPESILLEPDENAANYLQLWTLARRHGADLLSDKHEAAWWVPRDYAGEARAQRRTASVGAER